MTEYELLSLMISIASSIAVVVTLFFLIKQTRAMTDQTTWLAKSVSDSTMDHWLSRILEISHVFIEFPELRPYFYDGLAIEKNDPQYQRAVAIALMLLDMFDYYLRTHEVLPAAFEENHNYWETWITDMFKTSPLLLSHFRSVKDWYPEPLSNLWNEANKQLQGNSSQVKESIAPKAQTSNRRNG